MHYELCIQHYFNLSSQRLNKLKFEGLQIGRQCGMVYIMKRGVDVMTFLHGKRRKLWIALIATGLVLAVLFGACAIYLGDYYHADMAAVEAFAPNVSMQTGENGNIVFAPENAEAGFIFYPGGKVEHTAYVPLMKALA